MAAFHIYLNIVEYPFCSRSNYDELAEIAIDLGAEDIINNDDGSVE